MFKVKVSKKSKLVLLTLLSILNIVIRIPSIPHEKGYDSFYIHALANSITTFGQANWWIHWLSVFGLYPYSYASSLPFYLSGISQLTGLTGTDMEKSILLYSVLIGLYSIFTAYVLAGLIYKDFLFKYILAFCFSTSQGVLIFSTWEPSTRGVFIILLPLFLFFLLSKIGHLKKIFLLLTLGIFLSATHHFFYFLVPFTIVYLILRLFSKYSIKIKHISNNYNFNYLYIVGLVTIFLIPFFTRSMIEAGSRYGWIFDMLITNARWTGPLIIFAISGIAYLTLKKNKKIEEWYFLIVVLILIPFNYDNIYGAYMILLNIIVFISVAFRNLLSVSLNSNICKVCIIILILSSTTFSSFYNHERTNDLPGHSWFMKSSTYSASVWSNEYIPQGTYGFGIGDSNRLFSASDGHPIMPRGATLDLAYGFIDRSKIRLTKVSATSPDFYFEGPYSTEDMINIPGKVNWILENDIDSKNVVGIIDNYNLSYFVMPSIYSSRGIQSIKSKKSSIFNNGRISIWIID